MEYFSKELNKNPALAITFTPDSPLKEAHVIKHSTKSLVSLKNNPPFYVSTELTPRAMPPYIGAALASMNICEVDLKKTNFVLDCDGTNTISREKLKDNMIRCCDKIGAQKIWVNACTPAYNKHFKDDICKNLIDDPNYPIFSGNVDCLYQVLNKIAYMAIECILRGESDPHVKQGDDEEDGLTWNERYDYDDFIEDDLYEYNEYTEEQREENFQKSENRDILGNIFNGKIPIVVRNLKRLRREVRLDPIKNKIYDDYVSERIPEYDNSKWQTKYKILKKFMLYPEDILTYFDALRLENIATQCEITREDIKIARLLLRIIEPIDEINQFISSNNPISPLYVSMLLFYGNELIKLNNEIMQFGNKKCDLTDAIELIDTITKDIRENSKYILTITSLLYDNEPIAHYMKEKFDEEFNHDADFAEIISMLKRITLKEKISDSGINGKPFDYGNVYGSDNEEEGMVSLVEEYEQKEKEKEKKKEKKKKKKKKN